MGSMLADSKRLEFLKANARKVAKPQAAFDVARLALRYAGRVAGDPTVRPSRRRTIVKSR